jgi:hypothetical protein
LHANGGRFRALHVDNHGALHHFRQRHYLVRLYFHKITRDCKILVFDTILQYSACVGSSFNCNPYGLGVMITLTALVRGDCFKWISFARPIPSTASAAAPISIGFLLQFGLNFWIGSGVKPPAWKRIAVSWV